MVSGVYTFVGTVALTIILFCHFCPLIFDAQPKNETRSLQFDHGLCYHVQHRDFHPGIMCSCRMDVRRSRFLEALIPAAAMEAARQSAIEGGHPEWKWAGQGITARGPSRPASGMSPGFSPVCRVKASQPCSWPQGSMPLAVDVCRNSCPSTAA